MNTRTTLTPPLRLVTPQTGRETENSQPDAALNQIIAELELTAIPGIDDIADDDYIGDLGGAA